VLAPLKRLPNNNRLSTAGYFFIVSTETQIEIFDLFSSPQEGL
jgi:hypothetical protein